MRLAPTFRWLALVALVCAITPFIEPLVHKALEDVGYYSGMPAYMADAMNWVAFIFGSTAAPYIIGSIIGLAIGAWADWLFRSFDQWRHKARSGNDWAHGLAIISCKEAACALLGKAPSDFAVSDRVQSIARELVTLTADGWFQTTAASDVHHSGVRTIIVGQPTYPAKAATLDTVIYAETLDKYAALRGFDISWAGKLTDELRTPFNTRVEMIIEL